MSRQSSLVKNTGVLAIGFFLPKLISIVTLPLLTGHLTEDDYGLLDVMSTWITFLAPFISLKLDGALFRMLLESRDDDIKKNQTIANVVYPVAVLTAIWILILSFVFPSSYLKHKTIFFFWLCSQIFYDVLMQMLRGLSNNKLYAVMSSLGSVTNSLFIIIFICFKDGGFLEVILATILGLQIVNITILLLYRKTIIVPTSYVNKKTIKSHLAYSVGLIPNTLGNWVVGLSDRLIINMFLPLQSSAVYAVANKLPALVVLVQSTFATAWTESAALSANETDKEEYYSSTFETSIDLSAGLICVSLAFTPLFFTLLVRGNYEEAIIHNNIILVGTYFLSITWFLGGIYLAYKDTIQVAKIAILSALINVAINFTFINFIGLFAASLSTAIAYFVTMIQRLMHTVRKGWISVDRNRFAWRIIAIMAIFDMEIIVDSVIQHVLVCGLSIILFCAFNKKTISHVIKRFKKA